jgi:hypothetical protein
MKRLLQLLILFIVFSIGVTKAQDSLYFYKTGNIVYRESTSQIDSTTFLSPNYSVQDSIYVMKSSVIKYKRAVSDIDSITFEKINRESIVDKIASDAHYSIFYQGLIATGLSDSLLLDRDKSYNPALYDNWSFPSGAGESDKQVPLLKRYGYTVLMESDSIMRVNGITDLSSMINYAKSVYDPMYPEDAYITDVKNRKNSLNRFIAYHIINKKLGLSKFIDAYDTGHMIKTVDLYEYLEPMCPNSLIEIKKERASGLTNLINKSTVTSNAIHIITPFNGKDIYNGFYYGIDRPLIFDMNVCAQLSSKRLRFDAASFLPELTNNTIRGLPMHGLTTALKNTEFLLPRGYIDRITSSAVTSMYYLSPNDKYSDYEGDEIFFSPGAGNLYDFTITTPSIPAGTYEVRLGYIANESKAVTQMYFDGVPAPSTPVDFTQSAITPEIGWVLDGSDPGDPFGYENDKTMFNHGYMKGPDSYKHVTSGFTANVANVRLDPGCLRKIWGTFTFRTAGNHTLRVTGLSGGQFQIDYIEFVPTSALEAEDIH